MRWSVVSVKAFHIRFNLFAGTETVSLSVYEPIAIHILLGRPSPRFGGRGGARGRVWYPKKLLHISNNLFDGT